jgi:hypothetical protein
MSTYQVLRSDQGSCEIINGKKKMCSSGVTKLMTRFVLRPIRSGRFGVGVVMMFVSFHSWTDEKLRIQNNFVRCLETLCMGLDHRLATVHRHSFGCSPASIGTFHCLSCAIIPQNARPSWVKRDGGMGLNFCDSILSLLDVTVLHFHPYPFYLFQSLQWGEYLLWERELPY